MRRRVKKTYVCLTEDKYDLAAEGMAKELMISSQSMSSSFSTHSLDLSSE